MIKLKAVRDRIRRRKLAQKAASDRMMWTQFVLAIGGIASAMAACVSIGLWVFEAPDRSLARASYRAQTIHTLQETLAKAGDADSYPLARFEVGNALRQMQALGAPRRISGSHIRIEQADLSCLKELHLEADSIELNDVILDHTDITIVARHIKMDYMTGSNSVVYLKPALGPSSDERAVLDIQHSILDDFDLITKDDLGGMTVRTSVVTGGTFETCCGPVEIAFSYVSHSDILSRSGITGHIAGFDAVKVNSETYANYQFCFLGEDTPSQSRDFCPPDAVSNVYVSGEVLTGPRGAWFLLLGGVQIAMSDDGTPTFTDAGPPSTSGRADLSDLRGLGASIVPAGRPCPST